MKRLNIDSSWTLFLDRDGVINQRIMGGYVKHPDAFFFEQGVLQAIADFTTQFQHIFVVTNQQGIAKGIMTTEELHHVHNYMCSEIERAGGKITHCYFAPEFAHDEHSTRKPKPNMGINAQRDYPEINFQQSIMVGDTDSDILFGKQLGMVTVRIKQHETITVTADFTINNLFELKKILAT
jgi:D-glycero-D-manno-heptose 1,7-bisphosphate phosphatase